MWNLTHEGINNYSVEAEWNFVFIGEAVVHPVIFTFGIITNALCIRVLRHTKIGEVFRTCLTQLAISDLIASCLGLTKVLLEIILYRGNVPFGYWYPGVIANCVLYFIFLVFVCTSSIILIACAVFRCAMISRPLTVMICLTRSKANIIMALLFSCTIILYLPTSLYIMWLACYNEPPTHTRCTHLFALIPNVRKMNIYATALAVLFGPVVLVVNITCLIIIRYQLSKKNKAFSNLQEKHDSVITMERRNSNTAKVTKTLVLLLVCDCVCTLPQVIQGIGLTIAPEVLVFNKDKYSYAVFDVIVEIFFYCRLSYNFWLYIFTNSEFRKRCANISWKQSYIRQRLAAMFSLQSDLSSRKASKAEQFPSQGTITESSQDSSPTEINERKVPDISETNFNIERTSL